MQVHNSKPHYALLDGLRGVAALLVVWYHVFEGFQFAGNKPVIDFINHGYLAVDFFFILSGFVVGYAYDSRWGKTLTTGGFFRRRLIRLQPMVCMGALIGAVSFLLTGMERWDGSHATLWLTLLAFVCGCLMLPALPGMPREVRGNGEMFPLNGPCWSLFFEYIGNICYALFIRRLSNKTLGWLTLLLGAGLASFALFDLVGYGMLGVGWTLEGLNFFGGLLRMAFSFTAGMLIARHFRPIPIRGAFWICTVVLIALFHVPYIEGNDPVCLNGIFELSCIFVIFPILVWIAASGTTTDRRSTQICQFVGDLSYPLYMVHYPVMYLFYAWLIETKQYTLGETWPVALSVYALNICIAYVCLRCYDLPMRRWLTQRLLQRKAR